MVDILSATSTANQNTTTNDASASLADNFEMFLTLLTEQLKNQDPLSPLDSNEFVNQLVQFSSVEQQINQTNAINDLVTLQQSAAAGAATSYLGRDVEIRGASAPLADDQARWTYNVDSAADSVDIAILDASGVVVASADGDTNLGAHEFVWDGLNNSGETLPDGVYTLQVSALYGEDSFQPTITSHGVATGVDLSGDEPAILLGGHRAALTDVLTVEAVAGD